MPASKLSIYNQALGHLGERRLANLSEAREPRRVLDDYYNDVVAHCLEMGSWKFATRLAKLDRAANVVSAFGFRNAFRKPGDWVRTCRISESDATQTLGRLCDAALRLPDDAAKARLIDTSRAIFGALEGKGYLAPDEAQKRARGWVEDYAVQALKARPAQEQFETLRSLAEGTAGSVFGLIPQEQRERLQREAERDATIAAVRGAVEKAEKWKHDIIDASEDLRNIPRSAIENDPELDPTGREAVLRAYDEAQAKAASFDDALRRLQNGGPFTTNDPQERENVERLFTFFGGDETAAKFIVARTGIVPGATSEQARDAPVDIPAATMPDGNQSAPSSEHSWWDAIKQKILDQLARPAGSDKDGNKDGGNDVSDLLPILLFLLLKKGGNRGGGLPKTKIPAPSRQPGEKLPSGQQAKSSVATPQPAPPGGSLLAKDIAQILDGLTDNDGKKSGESDQLKPESETDKTPGTVRNGDDRSVRTTPDQPTGNSPGDDAESARSHDEALEQSARRVSDAAYELRRAALRQLPPAATLRGDKLGDASDIRNLRRSARTYIRENFIRSQSKSNKCADRV